MRTIESHKGDPCNASITIEVSSLVTTGGASQMYFVTLGNINSLGTYRLAIPFQQGNPAHGVNGLTNEVLLAIVADQLECFQKGEFACPDNARALEFVKAALEKHKDRHWRVATPHRIEVAEPP